MLVHPFDDDVPAAVVRRSSADTAIGLGADAPGYQRLLGASRLDPGRSSRMWCSRLPGSRATPSRLARFGLRALQPAGAWHRVTSPTERARALFGGIAAHGMIPLEKVPSGAIGLVLGALAHVVGWPMPRGGAQRLADSLASYLRSLGGRDSHQRTGQRDRGASCRKGNPVRSVASSAAPHRGPRPAGLVQAET